MMSNQSVGKTLARDLVAALPKNASDDLGATGLDALIANLIDVIPPLGDSEILNIHRCAIQNLLQSKVTTQAIQAQASTSNMYSRTNYSYAGSYANYQQAFFGSVTVTPLASAIEAQCTGLPANWWQTAATITLTEQMYTQVSSLPLNTGALSSALTNMQTTFSSSVAAPSYYCVFTQGFPNTVAAIKAIHQASDNATALAALKKAVTNGTFIENLKTQQQGNAAEAAWFLWNIWMCLKALGDDNVGQTITHFKNMDNVPVPNEINASNWWTNYYSWFQPLLGATDAASAQNITSALPETASTWQSGGYHSDSPASYGNGYSMSYTNWSNQSSYKPPPSSCVGANSKVLMHDGTTKRAADIRPEDKVFTQLGPRKVVLIETPNRAGRKLYQLNDSEIYLTASHPVRGADPKQVARYCIEPCLLMDVVPTMVEAGIGTLEQGVQVTGLTEGKSANIGVTSINTVEPGKDDEWVYDILLENWERDFPTIFVGGPDQFFALDNESADALYDPATTVAVVSALKIILPEVRKFESFPNQHLTLSLTGIDMEKVARDARASESLPAFTIPGPEFYMYEGKWDENASQTELHLIWQLGRQMRILTANHLITEDADGMDYLFRAFDLYKHGGLPLSENLKVSFHKPCDGASLGSLRCGTSGKWSQFIDKEVIIPCGVVDAIEETYLQGRIYDNDELLGSFTVPKQQGELNGKLKRIPVFDKNHAVVAFIWMDVTRVNGAKLQAQKRPALTRKKRLSLADAIGKEIGFQVCQKFKISLDASE